MSFEPNLQIGVNLPWLQYGCDFGANAWQPYGGLANPERGDRLLAVLDRIADAGLTTVRWFLLCDGRAGLRSDRDGRLVGIDDSVLRDLDVALDALAERNLSAVFVLFDFHWWRRGRQRAGVTTGGRRRDARPGERRRRLLEGVVAPIVRHCSGSVVAAWDVVNEPEWATFGVGSPNPLLPGRTRMREFLAACVETIRAESTAPVTVGLASWRGMPLVDGLGLDALQVHWYDRHERQSPLVHAGISGCECPVWLGEFPTAGSSRSVTAVLGDARTAGYGAAFGWSAAATDEYSDFDALIEAVRSREVHG